MEQPVQEQKQKKGKGGRPAKPVKRQRIISIRFTKIEYFIIAQKAGKAGLSLSDYIRESAIHAVVKARFSEEERHFFRQFAGMANNLNQMAKLAHQEGLLSALLRFENDLNMVDEALKRFKP
ncbi:MAG: plasmid mobilization protein [Chitinophagaceae bacterium]